MSIDDALQEFVDAWVAAQEFTPRFAYERTLRLLRFQLERDGRSGADDLATLAPDDLMAFVRWHGERGLADDADGTRKVALHVARLGAFLAQRHDRPDLAISRDALRAASGRT